MNQTHTLKRMAILVVLMASAWAWAATPSRRAQEDHADHDHSGHVHEAGDHDGHDHEAHPDDEEASHEHPTLAKLDMVLAAVDKATTAVKFGDKKAVLVELDHLRTLIVAIRASIVLEHGQRVFVNSRCPIMGDIIDPTKIESSLTRIFAGKKIAFCCADCLPKWDKLPEAHKLAKSRAMTPATSNHDHKEEGDHSGHVH